jgi:hypothetical protein
MGLQSTSPAFYRTYLIEEWHYNLCSPLLAIFPGLPEHIEARPRCNKTLIASVEDFLYQDLSNVSGSRQGGGGNPSGILEA